MGVVFGGWELKDGRGEMGAGRGEMDSVMMIQMSVCV